MKDLSLDGGNVLKQEVQECVEENAKRRLLDGFSQNR